MKRERDARGGGNQSQRMCKVKVMEGSRAAKENIFLPKGCGSRFLTKSDQRCGHENSEMIWGSKERDALSTENRQATGY